MRTVPVSDRDSEVREGGRVDGRAARTRSDRRGPLRPLDVIMFGYLFTAAVLVVIGRDRVPHWWAYPAAYAALATAVAALLVVHARSAGDPAAADRGPGCARRVLGALRRAYPLVLAPVLYPMAGGSVLAVHGRWLDADLVAAEAALWGGAGGPPPWPVSRPLTELFYACYMSYYLFIVVPPVLLIARRRLRDLERLVTTVAAAVYTCYLGYLLVPVRGPVHLLADRLDPPVLTGYVLAPAQQLLMAYADPPGTCFPSAHVAGAWAVVLAVRRIHGPRAFRVLLLPVTGLTLSVVYTRYHYPADAVAGLAVALAADAVTARLWRREVTGARVPGSRAVPGPAAAARPGAAPARSSRPTG